MRAAIVAALVAVVPACSFTAEPGGVPRDDTVDAAVLDAAPLDAYIPDAGSCLTSGKTCAGPVLRTCLAQGSIPTEETCNWGCLSDGAPRCGRLQPSGGALTMSDLDPDANLMARSGTSLQGTINTDTGAITGVRAAGTDLVDGITFQVRNGVGVFRVRSLELNGLYRVVGANALAIAATDKIDIVGQLDARGTCTDNAAGPGGRPGGTVDTPATGEGAGASGAVGGTGDTLSSAGGGGAGASNGGSGGRPEGTGMARTAAGTGFGDPAIPALREGGGGGGGAGGMGGFGGGGGGAVQLVANGRIKFHTVLLQTTGINAGGCGGRTSARAGGGGGGGGTILVEAKFVELASFAGLAANGGGGGGGVTAPGADGSDAELGGSNATGGTGASGDGGTGGARLRRTGAGGNDANQGGGGGGGAGRIKVATFNGENFPRDIGALVSPALNDGATHVSANVR